MRTHTDGTICLEGTRTVPDGHTPCCAAFDRGTLACVYDIRYEWQREPGRWMIAIAEVAGGGGITIRFCPHCGTDLADVTRGVLAGRKLEAEVPRTDLLALLYTAEITADDADRIYHEVVEKGVWDWAEALGLSEYEITANMHGVGFKELAKWRYEGWPDTCGLCHLPLDYRLYGWEADFDEDEKPYLIHIECPTIPS